MTSEDKNDGFEPPPHNPPLPTQGGEANPPFTSDQGFEAPPTGDRRFSISFLHEDAEVSYGPAGAGEAAAYAGDTDVLAGVPRDILDAKHKLEASLDRAATESVTAQAADAFSGLGNVQGVAVGLSDGDVTTGVPPGAPCLVVYVAERTSPDQVQALVAEAAGVSASALASSVPTRGVRVGIIDAQPHRFRARPQAPAGASVGHPRITAGTIGALVTGRSAPRDKRMLILSNNHVLANVNDAGFGDPIIQPGPTDGGVSPADQVGVLDRFVTINFDKPNYVDAATAWCWPDRVRRDHVFLSGGSPQYFQMGSTPIVPVLEMAVTKSGRTTQVTTGRITGIGGTVNVNYAGGRTAHFQDVISITGHSGFFSQGGDSGSVIMTNNAERRPVGLLFAGGGGTTFACRIERVLDALDIRFV
jgi:hypothetical protein